MRAIEAPSAGASEQFRHEAFLYRGQDELVRGVATYVRESLAASEPVLLALSPARAAAVREEVRADIEDRDGQVLFVDVTRIGANPGRIIPAWRDFLLARPAGGKRVRAVGETMWAGRSPAEAREVQRHEALIASALADLENFWLLCPYDVRALDAEIVAEAYRSHPHVLEGGVRGPSPTHDPTPGLPGHLDGPLPAPPPEARSAGFGPGDLSGMRRLLAGWADGHGMARSRVDLFVLAVNELTTNSVEHGGGTGTLLLWREAGFLVAEVRDAGHIASPLVGRTRPDQEQGGGRGVWLVNQVCDLVEIRSSPAGTTVRVRMSC